MPIGPWSRNANTPEAHRAQERRMLDGLGTLQRENDALRAEIEALRRAEAARGMEAQSGETEGLDPKGDSPVPSGTRPEPVPQAEALTDAERLTKEALEQLERYEYIAATELLRLAVAAIDASIRAGKGGER